MKVIAVGDSFTSGDEVIDDQLYLGFPGYRTHQHDDIVNRYDWHRNTKELRSKDFDRIVAREKQLSFPSKLAEILQCDVLNLGQGGASQDKILNTLTHSIIQEQIRGTSMSELIVTLNITSTSRFMVPLDNQWTSIILGHTIPSIHSRDHQAFDKLYTLNTNEVMIYERHASVMLQTIGFLKSLGIKFVLIDSVFFDDIKKFAFGKDSTDFLRKCWEIILADSPIISMQTVAVEKGITDIWCPGNHFSKYVHEEFAKELAVTLSKL